MPINDTVQISELRFDTATQAGLFILPPGWGVAIVLLCLYIYTKAELWGRQIICLMDS